MDIKVVENTGWVLVDFPSNFSQSMLLEKALSGYSIPADLDPTTREQEIKESSLLVQPTPKPEPPKTLVPSGLDAVIWFNCERKECLRRALGRRIDPGTGTRYHIEDEPPAVDQSPLCEIIEAIDEQAESTACLLDRWLAFDQTKSGLTKWLTQFGDEATSSNLMVEIDANQGPDDIFKQIDAVINQVCDRKNKHQKFLRSSLQATLIREEEIAQEKKRAEEEDEKAKKAHEEAVAAAEAAGEPIPPTPAPTAGGRAPTRSLINSKSSMRDGSQFTGSDFVHERDNIDADFKGTLMALWKRTSTSYRT